MKRSSAGLRALVLVTFFLATLSFAHSNGDARPANCIDQGSPPADIQPGEIFQQFSRNGAPSTAWRIKWASQPGSGLILAGASFQRTPGENWIQVVAEARIAELFVPYHSGTPRFEDVQFGFELVETSVADAGTCGELIGTPPVAVKEVRDRGVAWKDDAGVHRGQELVLWGTLDAANYNYIIQYRFQDDGTVFLDAAGTSANLPGAELEGHMHTVFWRIDVDLDGPENDKVSIARHIEIPAPDGASSDLHQEIASEGFADRSLQDFLTVHVEDTVSKNKNGKSIGYEVAVSANGAARHWMPGEEYLQHDYWFTVEHPGELIPQLLPSIYVSGEAITGNDSVIWVSTPIHHEPHDEDGKYDDSGVWDGIALARWGSVVLKPHNLFSTTPLYP